jgi:asparagine synthase (glutamine-hydrolysing)
MCGISGVYQFKNTGKANLKESVEKMNQSQARRGPDDEGIFLTRIYADHTRTNADVLRGSASSQRRSAMMVMGHRRLSILDLSEAGRQPMVFKRQGKSDKGKDLVITFNGEIYNFLELKKDLKNKGYKFKTKTDTEVILALYAEYGEKSFSMLRGMFAFGLWDSCEQKLFLVKDRYGIKPLYYYADGEKLIFTSTVKAITESGLIPFQKNPDAFIGFLLFGSVPLPLTTIKNVFSVPAGHYLEIDGNGKQKLIEYYNPLTAFQNKLHYADDRTANVINEIRGLLNESVNLHLISDAPLGVFLSGGLDFSALAAIAASRCAEQARNEPRSRASSLRGRRGIARNNQRLITLSIIFDEPEFSEQKYQKMVAEKIGSVHREIKITKNDFLDSFGDIFSAMDQPTIDGVNTFFIAKAAKEAGLKTVLSGLGADEIFLGYPHFRRAEILRKIQKLPIKSVIKLLSYSVINPFLDGRYSKLSYLSDDSILNFYLSIRGLFAPQEAAEILGISAKEVEDFIKELNNSITNNSITKLHPVDLLSYLELKFYLQNQLLKDTDFMSMHHSIEVRVPFLDHPLVEYLSGLPPEVKLGCKIGNWKLGIGNLRLKPLLAAAVGDLLPQEIFTRPKMGFTFPFQKWLGEVNSYSVNKLLSQKLNNSLTNNSITKSHWSRLWAKEVLKNYKI